MIASSLVSTKCEDKGRIAHHDTGEVPWDLKLLATEPSASPSTNTFGPLSENIPQLRIILGFVLVMDSYVSKPQVSLLCAK